MTYKKLGIQGKGLWIFENQNILVYSKGKITLYSNKLECIQTCKLPLNFIKYYCCQNRFFERIMNCEPRFAVGLSETEVLIQFGKEILRYSCDKNSFDTERINMASRALSACKICKVAGFKDSIVLGDYGANPERGGVNIYQRSLTDDDWRVVYTFKPGTVKHIHGFYSDNDKNCVYIMTGDTDAESNIWCAINNFEVVEKVVGGQQRYRCCQMFSGNGKLFYLTDAPSEPNYLCRLDGMSVNYIERIRGTGIYGVRTDHGFLCSTTCEPDVDDGNGLKKMIVRKPGVGIDGRNVDVMYIAEDGTLETIYTYQNDGLPLRLMQYGTVVFSNCCGGKVLCTPIAVKKEDYNCWIFEDESKNRFEE